MTADRDHDHDQGQDDRSTLAAGARDGIPFGLASLVLAVSFGVVARDAGFSVVATIVFSAVVYAGSAQFGAVAVVTGGGSTAAALGTAALVNARFLPMGIALAPSLRGGAARRALLGQPIVDASWAMAARGEGRYAVRYLLGHSAVLYVAWVAGTVIGAVSGEALGDTDALGLDAIFPAFFIAVLAEELRDRAARRVALGGAAIAVALIPFTPAGVPVLAASVAALGGLARRGAREEAS